MKSRDKRKISCGISVVVSIIVILLCSGCATSEKAEPLTKTFPQNLVTNIRVVDSDKGKRVIIEGESYLVYTFFKLVPKPLRLVIDIPQTELSQEISTPIKVNDEVIQEIVVTPKEGDTEISISLNKLVGYHVEKEGNFLYLDMEKQSPLLVRDKEVEIVEEPPQPVNEEIVAKELPIAQGLIDVTVDTSQKDRITLKLRADGRIGDYDAFDLKKPTRLVIDLWNIKRKFPSKTIPVNSPYLKRVRLGDYSKKIRLVLDIPTKNIPSHRMNRVGDELNVVMGKEVKEEITAAKQAKVSLPVPEKARKEEKGLTPVYAVGEVIGIDFKQIEDKSRIIISTSAKALFNVKKDSDDTVLIEIKGMTIPQKLIRPLDTHEFISPVSMITPTNVVVDGKNSSRVLVKLRKMVSFAARQEDGKIYVDFERPVELRAERAKPLEVVSLKEPPIAKKEEKPEEVKKAEVVPIAPTQSPKPAIPSAEAEGAEQKEYSGKRISLDFKDADIDNILRLFAEVSDMNIIATEDVKGKVTIRLINVPWDQAFNLILQANNLGAVRIGNVVRIAPMERLAKEMRAKAEAAKATVELEPIVTEMIEINYSKAVDLAPKVKDFLSSRGSVTIDERTNTLIIKDMRVTLEHAKELIRVLDAQTPQVLIQAKIVEANTNFSRELGISWGGQVEDNFVDQNVHAEGTGASSGDFVVDLPASAGSGSGGALEFLIGNLQNTKYLRVRLSALEENGEGRIISSPRITTLNHREASIEQGLRIPYLVYTEEGISTAFIEANLKLVVTPHVTSDGHIKMELKASKDTPDWSHTVMSVPAIDKREVKTEVLVKDGEVVVIGGVYLYEKSGDVSAVPLLYKIPVLGWLFQKKTKTDTKRELLIFIAPSVIQPRRIGSS